jgi:hypothetical protein
MPTVRSTTYLGRTPGTGFAPRSSRWVSFNATVDMGNLVSLGERMQESFGRHLTRELGSACDSIIADAKMRLVPGHGYDTGLLRDTLVRKLVDGTVGIARVAYDLESDQADYWVWVEFGHMLRNGDWWEGYHFLSESVIANEGLIRQKVREAWAATVVELGAQAAVVSTIQRIL